MADQDGPVEAECVACEDSGWQPHWCNGVDRMCGRRRVHREHEYVTKCPCRPINRTWNEKQGSYQRHA